MNIIERTLLATEDTVRMRTCEQLKKGDQSQDHSSSPDEDVLAFFLLLQWCFGGNAEWGVWQEGGEPACPVPSVIDPMSLNMDSKLSSVIPTSLWSRPTF